MEEPPWTSDPTPVRGGRAKRHFELTAAGDRAIRQARATAQRLWSGGVAGIVTNAPRVILEARKE